MIEEWKDIVGYEGLYQISSLGRIKSFKFRKTYSQGRLLYPWLNGRYYFEVELSKEGQKKSFRVHQLVATAFIGPCPPDKEVDHIDLNKKNNNYKNLQYLTQKEHTDKHVPITNSGFRGVYYKPNRKKPWYVKIFIGSSSKHLGYYKTPQEANEARVAFYANS